MQEITILSGKGGTGKTSITAGLASIASKAVFCDNDVDAADLHLIFNPEIKEEHAFASGLAMQVNKDGCIDCGFCIQECRFDAIKRDFDGKPEINQFTCEGCRLCERICPVGAISSKQNNNNSWFVSDTRIGTLVHAKMGPGEENSGKLVSTIRKRAKEIAKATNADFIINDGPPGIGCPVIASLTGTGKVLLVIEASVSGFHDIQRLIELNKSFNLPQFAVINKFDINHEITQTIEEYLQHEQIPLLGKIPFDPSFVMAMIEQKSIIEFDPIAETSSILRKVWEQLSKAKNPVSTIK